ncbi:MAG: hypothetical protein C0498_01865 [Anaerolinea sp.]|nr:hypothetical protein [Anaerolinea sp.]
MPSLRWTSLATVAVLVVAGCGVGGPLPSSAGPSGPPASGSPPPSATPPADCPNFVEVVETGPLPGDDGAEDGPVAREQDRLRADVEAASAYGAAHTGEFASIRFENGPRVRIVIGFTTRLAEHCAALRSILEYPDEFEIIRQPTTAARLEEIQREIMVLAGDRMQSTGIGAGTIDIQLRADGEAIADRIQAAYGEIVTITVGMLRYPDRSLPADASCALLPDPIISETPLVAEAALDVAAVRPGADFRGTVTVTNTGPEIVEFASGDPMTAVVFRAGSNRPVGGFTGAIGGVGTGGTLAPGDSLDIGVLGGTASCDPALGYALPPGRYDVRVPVDQYTMRDNAPTEISYLLSEPVPLTIVP